jgi:hypothetical protein
MLEVAVAPVIHWIRYLAYVFVAHRIISALVVFVIPLCLGRFSVCFLLGCVCVCVLVRPFSDVVRI